LGNSAQPRVHVCDVASGEEFESFDELLARQPRSHGLMVVFDVLPYGQPAWECRQTPSALMRDSNIRVLWVYHVKLREKEVNPAIGGISLHLTGPVRDREAHDSRLVQKRRYLLASPDVIRDAGRHCRRSRGIFCFFVTPQAWRVSVEWVKKADAQTETLPERG
jgi:hypothetical protein